MAVIQSTVRWTRQPQFPAKVDLNHPLANGLIALYSGTNFYNAKANTVTSGSVTAGAPSYAPSACGVGVNLTSGAQSISGSQIRHPFLAADAYSIECFLFMTTPVSLGGIVKFDGSSGTYRALFCNFGGTDIAVRDSGGASTCASGVAYDSRKVNHIVFTSTGNSGTGIFYKNGVQVASTTAPSSADRTASLMTVRVGDAEWSAVAVANVAKASYYNRVLRPSEVAALAINPWQIFTPIQREIWTGPIAAIGGASNAPRYFHRTQAGQA